MQTELGGDKFSDKNSLVMYKGGLIRNEFGIIDFQTSKSFHNNLLSPTGMSNSLPRGAARKMLHLPSDHPDMQGVKEVPTINPKSVELAQKNGRSKKVHQRLYNHTLLKDELASKLKIEKEEEDARKQEYLLRKFKA